MNEFNKESLDGLIKASRYNNDKMKLISRCLQSFEDYHFIIFTMQKEIMLNGDLQMINEMDAKRRICHNSLISNVNILNRLAKEQGLANIYDGIVSEERPYRRQVADAILAFVEKVIKERR